MRAEERRRILGDDVIARIHEEVAAAPDPSPELIDELRRILAPAAARLQARKASEAHRLASSNPRDAGSA